MKKIFVLMMACVFALASCARDERTFDNNEDNVDVIITTDLSSINTRAALNAGSQNSGLDNVDIDDFDVRYQLEVWYDGAMVRNGLLNIEPITGKPSTTTFTVNLARGKTYRLVLWADFVEKGSTADLHYDTSNGLENIVMTATAATYVFNDESKDAYCASVDYLVPTSPTDTEPFSVTLKRPLAKIRFIATDYNSVESGDVDNFSAHYGADTDYPVYTSFNAVTGSVGTSSFLVPYGQRKTIVPADPSGNEMEVMWDYLFVPAAKAADGLHRPFTIYYNGTQCYKTFDNAAIVVKPNMLTTVKAPLFTSARTINVIIDDRFDEYSYPISSSVFIDETGYPTIAAAMADASDNDVINLIEGVFAEDVNVKDGVTVLGAGDATVITGYITLGANTKLQNLKSYYLGEKITDGTSTRSTVSINSPGVTIEGVTFETGDGRNFLNANVECIITNGAATDLIFKNNTISAPYWKGIVIVNSADYEFTGNTFINLNPFSVSIFAPMTITGNTFVRTGGAYNTQMIHLIDASVTLKDATQLTGDIAAQVAQIKESNTWVGGSTIFPKYAKPVRVQGTGADFIAGQEGTNPAGWSTQNP